MSDLDPLNVKALGGEVEEITLNEKLPCSHKFSYRTAGEVVCVRCNVGFFIQGDEELRHGHLFKGNKKII
jgi:hypothetical protein